MLLVNFKKWSNTHIFITLIVMTLLFAFFMPQTQHSKNMMLYDAVMENNVTKAQYWINKGAQKNLLIPQGLPLISIAIEHENDSMVSLLMLKADALIQDYKGYHIMEHVIQKDNKKILKLMVDVLEHK